MKELEFVETRRDGVTSYGYLREKPKTNADNLPLMTTADLAALCSSPCPPDQTCGRNMVGPLPECRECWRRWLESEADNGA